MFQEINIANDTATVIYVNVSLITAVDAIKREITLADGNSYVLTSESYTHLLKVLNIM